MRKYRISIAATVIALLITFYFILLRISGTKVNTGPFPMSWTIDIPTEDTLFGNLFYDPYINDSLPHIVYKKIQDSVNRIKDEIKLTNRGAGVGSGFMYGHIGLEHTEKNPTIGIRPLILEDSLLKLMDDTINNLYSIFPGNSYGDSVKRAKYFDDLSWRYTIRSHKLHMEDIAKAEHVYFLTLNDYITDYENKFFIKDEKFYLAIIKWDSVRKRTFDSTKVGHYVRKEIPFRYSAEDKKIQIPISKKKYEFLNLIGTILYYIVLFSMIFIFLGLPVQVLIDISKGKAFTKANIRRFKIMSFVLLTYTLLKTFLPYIIKFLYRKQIPEELRLEPLHFEIINNLYLFLIAIALFIISKAFQKGYNLQEDQELTI